MDHLLIPERPQFSPVARAEEANLVGIGLNHRLAIGTERRHARREANYRVTFLRSCRAQI